MLTFIFGILGICFLFIVPTSVGAQCPVCIITVGGGMLIAKKLGIDDFLISIWISALNTAIAFWLAPKLKIKFFKNGHILALLLLATTLSYFYFTDQIGPSNQIVGLNKIVFGQVVGLVAMAIANHGYLFVKKKNNNKAPFPYAKVVFPLVLVFLVTIIFKSLFKL